MKMKEIQFTAPKVTELVERELNENIGRTEVLSKTLVSVVSAGTERDCLCGSPNTINKGYTPYPKALGYSAVGIVQKVGEDVTKVKPGDRVLVYHGTHAEYSVRDQKEITLVTENVTDEEAAMVVVGTMGIGGLRKTELELGESGMVMGMGILGQFALQGMRLSGAYPVIAADLKEERRQRALELGADYAFDPASPTFVEDVKRVTYGKGVNAIVEVTGASKALMQALDCVAWQGRIALLGCTRVSDCPIDFYQQVHRPGVKLIGAHNFVRPKVDSQPHLWTHHDDCRALLRFIESGRIDAKRMISEIHKPEECVEVYDRLANGKDFPVGVLFDWRNR